MNRLHLAAEATLATTAIGVATAASAMTTRSWEGLEGLGLVALQVGTAAGCLVAALVATALWRGWRWAAPVAVVTFTLLGAASAAALLDVVRRVLDGSAPPRHLVYPLLVLVGAVTVVAILLTAPRTERSASS